MSLGIHSLIHTHNPMTSNNEHKHRWNCGDWRRPRVAGFARTLMPTATVASPAPTSTLSPSRAALALKDVSNPFSLLPLRVAVLPLFFPPPTALPSAWSWISTMTDRPRWSYWAQCPAQSRDLGEREVEVEEEGPGPWVVAGSITQTHTTSMVRGNLIIS